MSKRELTPTEKAEKARRKALYEWVFINGKQVRVRRPPTVEGVDLDEFILRNADPLWLHQDGLWEHIDARPAVDAPETHPTPGDRG